MFTTNSDDAYNVLDQGQCQLDIPNKVAISTTINSSANGARSMLRNYGIFNFLAYTLGNSWYTSGYYVNMSNTYVSPSVISSPSSSYSSIWGYYQNLDIWGVYVLHPGNVFTISDPDFVFKEWFTTPMMNFYLDYIPGKIWNGIPIGKTFANFNIENQICLCPGADNSVYGPNVFVTYRNYRYRVTSGNFVSYAQGGGDLTDI